MDHVNRQVRGSKGIHCILTVLVAMWESKTKGRCNLEGVFVSLMREMSYNSHRTVYNTNKCIYLTEDLSPVFIIFNRYYFNKLF